MLNRRPSPALAPAFTFAGIQWPRYLATLPAGSLALRLAEARRPQYVGAVYHAPTPNNASGWGFYLDATAKGLRFEYADEVQGARIRHNGWHTDEDGAGELCRGIVARLPHGRGFLAGWTLGRGMLSELDAHIHGTELDAAQAADEEARIAAERMREDEQRQREEDAAEAARELAELEELAEVQALAH